MGRGGTIYAYTTPAYRRTRWSGRRRGRGLVKVGFTRRDPHVRIREQIGASSPEKVPYTLLLTAPAKTRRGRAFSDGDVHRVLSEMGVRNVHNEWFEATPDDVRRAISRVGGRVDRRRRRSPPGRRRGRGRRSRRRPRLTGRLLIVLGLAFVMLASAMQPESLRTTLTSASSRLLPD
ncbi:MAG: hypothetical protein CMO01_00190 [Thalassobius sp.]|nr:hypothetical protein [Thalassovita sp.]